MLDTRDRGNSLFPSLRQLAVTEWNNYYQVIVRLNWFRIYLVISPDKLVKYVAPDKSVGRGFWAVVVRVAATALVTLCCISQSELWWRLKYVVDLFLILWWTMYFIPVSTKRQ